MNNKVRVVLNMSNMSIPEKINKAQQVYESMFANPTDFPTPGNLLIDLQGAIVALRTAYADAADGGKALTAIMHHKENELLDAMRQVAVYVEKLTKADAGKVLMAGLEVRNPGTRQTPEFVVQPGAEPGTVKLRSRAHKAVFYKWQYSLTGSSTGTWVDALVGKVSRALITGLAPEAYWFRVVLVDTSGDHPGSAMPLSVR
jgi:hypothetical protein